MLSLPFLENIIAGKEEMLDLVIRFPSWKAGRVFSDGKVIFSSVLFSTPFLPPPPH